MIFVAQIDNGGVFEGSTIRGLVKSMADYVNDGGYIPAIESVEVLTGDTEVSLTPNQVREIERRASVYHNNLQTLGE